MFYKIVHDILKKNVQCVLKNIQCAFYKIFKICIQINVQHVFNKCITCVENKSTCIWKNENEKGKKREKPKIKIQEKQMKTNKNTKKRKKM